MQTGHEVVDGLRAADQVVGFSVGESARIGKPGEIAPVDFEIADGLFGAEEDHDRIAAFVGLADVDDFDAHGFGGDRVVIGQQLSIICEFLRGPDVVPENVLRRRNGGGFGKVVHQTAAELRFCGPLFDRLGKVGVERLLGG